VIPFRVSSQKNMTGDECFVFELKPLRGEKKFKPRPQNMILVLGRCSFQNLRRAVHKCVFYVGFPLGLLFTGYTVEFW